MGPICPKGVPMLNDVTGGAREAQQIAKLTKEKLTLDPVKFNWRLMRWRWTWVDSVDNLFEDLANILEDLEGIRANIVEATEKMKEIARLFVLKDGQLSDAILAFYQSFVAGSDDGVDQFLKMEILDNEPYIELDCRHMNSDVQKFCRYYTKFVKECFEAPDKIEDMIKKFADASAAVLEIVGNPDDLENAFASLDGYWKVRAIKYTKDNIVILKDSKPKLEEMKPKIEQALKDIKELSQNIKTVFDMSEIQKVGKQAKEQKKLKVSEILEAFTTKEKHSHEEILKIEEEQKKAKDEKKKNKEEMKRIQKEKDEEKKNKK